jgi:hypothetical protein
MNAQPALELDRRPRVLATVFALAVTCAVASRWNAPDHAIGRVAVRIVPRTEGELATVLAVAEDVWSEDVSVGDPLVIALAHSRFDQLHLAPPR